MIKHFNCCVYFRNKNWAEDISKTWIFFQCQFHRKSYIVWRNCCEKMEKMAKRWMWVSYNGIYYHQKQLNIGMKMFCLKCRKCWGMGDDRSLPGKSTWTSRNKIALGPLLLRKLLSPPPSTQIKPNRNELHLQPSIVFCCSEQCFFIALQALYICI